MRKTILYIAMSLDGYIADRKGSVDWLGGENPDYTGDYGYAKFVNDIDTIVMGRKTYHQIVTELSPDEWIYQGMETYVLTHHLQENTKEVKFTSESAASLIHRLRKESGKDIWICGGADLVNQLVCLDEIDEYELTIMPILLGSGIRLFQDKEQQIRLHFISCHSENGVLDCVYTR